MRILAALHLIILLKTCVVDTCTVRITDRIGNVDENFLSVTLDTGILRKKAWDKFNTSSPVLRALCQELSPAYLRFGGNAENQLIFYDNSTGSYPLLSDEDVIVMTESDWIKLNEFSTSVGYRLVFGLNAMLRKSPQDPWNASNALTLLRFNNDCGYHLDWELGNELNSHEKVYPLEGDRLGKDFVTLRSLTEKFNSTLDSRLFGPDISTHNMNVSLNFLSTFLQFSFPVLDAVTFHQYYLNGRIAVEEDFYNATILDELIPLIDEIQETVTKRKPIYLGETSSTYGGGTKGLSNAYAAGFMWLDKLGISAIKGIQVVMRQSLYGGSYSLLDDDFFANPDYWLSVLYKRLVGKTVLKVVQDVSNPNIRIYAHCTQLGSYYQTKGAATLYGMNLLKENVSLIVSNMTSGTMHIYKLQPHGSSDLKSRFVELNGKKLEMQGESLPPLNPLKVNFTGQPINLLPLSLNFLVFPEASIKFCH